MERPPTALLETVSRSLPSALRVFLQLSLALSLLSFAFLGICTALGLPAPFRWTFPGAYFAGDFTDSQNRFQLFGNPAFYTFRGPRFLYPAPLAIIYHLLFKAWGYRPHAERILEFVTFVIVFAALGLFFRALCRRGLSPAAAGIYCGCTLITSYPLLFDIQRGNVEGIIFATTLAVFWALSADRINTAAILLGVAIAFKFYPVVLLGLFLYPRRWRAIPLALASALAVTALSDFWLGPTVRFAFGDSLRNTQAFLEIYAQHYAAIGYDHSFFSLFKFFATPIHPNLVVDLHRYVLTAAISSVALYFLRIRALPFLNQACVLLILSITLPPVSYEYTLLHLYTCWGLVTLYLLSSPPPSISPSVARWTMAAFAFSFAPHFYVILHHQRFCAQVRFLGIAALLYIFLRFPFATSARNVPGSDTLRGSVFPYPSGAQA